MEQNYINDMINNMTNVRVYTINGYQLRGRIMDQSSDVLIIKADKVEKLVYKHAISTIEPVTE